MVKFNSSLPLFVLAWVVALMVVAAPVAQTFGQERGRDRKFDPKQYLQGLDKNKNEKLEPSEMVGRTTSYLKGMGFDTEKPISIEKIIQKIDKDKRSNERSADRSKESSKKTQTVPAFGVTGGGTPISSFGLSDVAPATSNFSDSVIEQVNETLERHDRNKDGLLDSGEIRKAKWGNPSPEESDGNGDGKLTRVELSNRYYAREQYRRKVEDQKPSTEKGKAKSSPKDRGQFGASSNTSRRRGSTTYSKSTSSSKGSASTSSPTVDREKYMKYAESLIKNYDKDSDGKLSAEEVKKMRRAPVGADADKDGFIDKSELVDSLSGANKKDKKPEKSVEKVSKGKDKKSTRTTGSASRSRDTSSFGGLDVNKDNRVEMHEFTDDWDEEKVKSFYAKDKNHDGVISAKEWKEN